MSFTFGEYSVIWGQVNNFVEGEWLDCMSSPGLLLHCHTMTLLMFGGRASVQPCIIPELSPGAEAKHKMG